MSQTKVVWNLGHRPDVSTHQNLQQQLEALRLQADSGNTSPAQYEESGKRILHTYAWLLQRHRNPRAQLGDRLANWVPPRDAIPGGVAAGNGHVVTFLDRGDQRGQQFRGMLQVR